MNFYCSLLQVSLVLVLALAAVAFADDAYKADDKTSYVKPTYHHDYHVSSI